MAKDETERRSAVGAPPEGSLRTETLQAAASGDPSAIRAVSDRFRPELTRFAHGRGADDPEGTVNIALTQTLAQLAGLRELTDPTVRAYLYRIIRRTLWREWNNRQGRTFVPLEEVEEGLHAVHDHSDLLADRELLDRLFEQLSARDRDLVTRRFLLDQSYEQIADDLELKTTSVRKATSRAVERMRVAAAAAVSLIVVAILVQQAGPRGVSGVDTNPATEGTTPAVTTTTVAGSDVAGSNLTLTDVAVTDSETPRATIAPVPDQLAAASETPATEPAPQTPTTELTPTVPSVLPPISVTPHTPGPCSFVFVNKSDRPVQTWALLTQYRHMADYVFLDGLLPGETKAVTMPIEFVTESSDYAGVFYLNAEGRVVDSASGFHTADLPCGSTVTFDP